MHRFILGIGFVFMSFFSYCQSEFSSFNYKIEDVINNEEFVVEDTLLIRWNGTEPTKKAERRFKNLSNCGLDVAYFYSKMFELPEEVTAFGTSFSYLEETEYRKTFISEEKDSEIHYLHFYYTIYGAVHELQKVTIIAENVRSKEQYMKYYYRFWLPR